MNLIAKTIYDLCPDDIYISKRTGEQTNSGHKKATIKMFFGNGQTVSALDQRAAQMLTNYANSGKKSVRIGVNLYPTNGFTYQSPNGQVMQYSAASFSFPIFFSSFKDRNKQERLASTIQPWEIIKRAHWMISSGQLDQRYQLNFRPDFYSPKTGQNYLTVEYQYIPLQNQNQTGVAHQQPNQAQNPYQPNQYSNQNQFANQQNPAQQPYNQPVTNNPNFQQPINQNQYPNQNQFANQQNPAQQAQFNQNTQVQNGAIQGGVIVNQNQQMNAPSVNQNAQFSNQPNNNVNNNNNGGFNR